MSRKYIPDRLKRLLQQEINSTCPFCGNKDADHFEIHHIDSNSDNNQFNNLIMICPTCHSKATKGDFSFDIVKTVKNNIVPFNNYPAQKDNILMFNAAVNSTVIGNNNNITVINKSTKSNTQKLTNKEKYPPGCLGYDIKKANYIGYLIDRYHEYKLYELKSKSEMNYQIFPSNLKKLYKIGQNRSIYNTPIENFGELAKYIQKRINSTKLALIKRGKKQYKNYQTYEEYIAPQ